MPPLEFGESSGCNLQTLTRKYFAFFSQVLPSVSKLAYHNGGSLPSGEYKVCHSYRRELSSKKLQRKSSFLSQQLCLCSNTSIIKYIAQIRKIQPPGLVQIAHRVAWSHVPATRHPPSFLLYSTSQLLSEYHHIYRILCFTVE